MAEAEELVIIPKNDTAMTTPLKKGPWSASEDDVLVDYVNKHGEGNWNAVQKNTGLQRCGKSCRLRWANHLRPNLKKGSFSVDEERLIIDLHSKLGNKWARISSHLPGRTDNEIKNYWNTRVKRRLRQGLPLYPNQINPNSNPNPNPNPNPTQIQKIHPFQQTLLPISFNKNQPNNNQNTLSSLFTPISLPSPFFSLHHPPPSLPPQFLRRCPNPFMARPISSPNQMGSFHLGTNRFGPAVGFESGQFPQTTQFRSSEGFQFDNLVNNNFELPSNQHDQNVISHHLKVDTNSSNVGRTRSGLLEDLLQESRVKATGRGVKRERDDSCLQWDDLTSENSFTGIKKEEADTEKFNIGNEDLSNMLDLIPSLAQVPGWCNNEGVGREESPAEGESGSVVSTENNYDSIDNKNTEPPPPPPIPAASVSTSDYDDNGADWNPNSYYDWEILPKIELSANNQA